MMKLFWQVFICSVTTFIITASWVQAQTPSTETKTLQAVVTSRPDSNLGTWTIGTINVEVTNDTKITSPNGPLEVGGCVTLSYVVVGTTNIALQIQAEEATVCAVTEPTSTPSSSDGTTWKGIIELQGRTDHSGAAIFLSEQPCATATFSQPQVTTTADGSFEVVGTTGQTFQCLQVTKALYLTLRQEITNPTVGTITLKAGDVNGDGVVNILDIATLAANYDKNNPAVDLNADGKVDIFDLVIAASNFK